MCSNSLYFILILLLVLGLHNQIQCQLTETDTTSPEIYPFHAFVSTVQWSCPGIIISENYILSAASCVNGSKEAMVYLGFHGDPYYKSNRMENGTQVIHSNEIIMHDRFIETEDNNYLNNIALVKLSTPANLSKTVQPGIIAAEKKLAQVFSEKLVNITGWYADTNNNLSVTRMRLLKHDTCETAYGKSYFKDQHFCLKKDQEKKRVNIVGSPVNVSGTIIGFTTLHTCSNNDCSAYAVIQNIAPFLDWISWNTNIDKAKLTGKEYETCKCLNGIEKLQENITQLLDKVNKSGAKTFEGLEKKDKKTEENQKDIVKRVTSLNELMKKLRLDTQKFEERLNIIEKDQQTNQADILQKLNSLIKLFVEGFEKLQNADQRIERTRQDITKMITNIDDLTDKFRNEQQMLKERIKLLENFSNQVSAAN